MDKQTIEQEAQAFVACALKEASPEISALIDERANETAHAVQAALESDDVDGDLYDVFDASYDAVFDSVIEKHGSVIDSDGRVAVSGKDADAMAALRDGCLASAIAMHLNGCDAATALQLFLFFERSGSIPTQERIMAARLAAYMSERDVDTGGDDDDDDDDDGGRVLH